MELKYTGIVLGKYDIGEADRIYSIYTREAGKIKAKAIGVRKSQSKLAGFLENFTLADITVAKKQGIGKITGSIMENNFTNLRKNLDALSGVFETLEIFDRLIGMEEKDGKIFNLLLEYLETMDEMVQSEKAEIISQGFIFQLLNLLGYKIEASVCAYCSSPLSERENFFSAKQGGTVCGRCAHATISGQGGEFKDLIKISNNVIKLIRIFFVNKLKSLPKLTVGKNEARELELISRLFLDWIIK